VSSPTLSSKNKEEPAVVALQVVVHEATSKLNLAIGVIVGLNRQKHLLEEDIMRRSDSTYVDLILHARMRRSDSTYVDPIPHAWMRRSDSTYVDPIPHARMRRSDSTYVDPILHARLGIAGIQNRTRGAENKVNSEQ
jgi:hypothetical protein